MHKKENNDYIKTYINECIESNEQVINNILYFTNFIIDNLIENCKFYRFHNIQYNNVAFIISQ